MNRGEQGGRFDAIGRLRGGLFSVLGSTLRVHSEPRLAKRNLIPVGCRPAPPDPLQRRPPTAPPDRKKVWWRILRPTWPRKATRERNESLGPTCAGSKSRRWPGTHHGFKRVMEKRAQTCKNEWGQIKSTLGGKNTKVERQSQASDTSYNIDKRT